MNVSITEASFEDLPDVARIHVESWREAYKGLVSQAYLDGMNASARQKKWEDLFRRNAAEDKSLHVARDGSEVVGFISFGRGRDARKVGFGEIYAVYLVKRCWGFGFGHALFGSAVRQLQREGMARVYLWVLDSNVRAIASYQKWGGRVEEDMILHGNIGGQEITEIMMNFGPEDR